MVDEKTIKETTDCPKEKGSIKKKKFTKKVLAKYKKAMKEKEIFNELVVLSRYDDILNTEILIINLNGIPAILKKEDLDYKVEWKTASFFVGKNINFTIKEIDEEEGKIYISRKDTQEILEKDIIERLKESEVFSATITGLIKYGAYIEIDGIYGLLKNVDFSDAYVPVSDVLKVGDKIDVRLKKITQGGRMSFEPVEKIKVESIMSLEVFERGQVVLGVVRSVRPWGAYVCIAPGVDALCSIPGTGELEEGAKVSFKITKVQEDTGKVRGKIIKILQQ